MELSSPYCVSVLPICIALVGGVILVVVVAVLYEGLKTLREILASLESKRKGGKTAVNADPDKTLLVPPVELSG